MPNISTLLYIIGAQVFAIFIDAEVKIKGIQRRGL